MIYRFFVSLFKTYFMSLFLKVLQIYFETKASVNFLVEKTEVLKCRKDAYDDIVFAGVFKN